MEVEVIKSENQDVKSAIIVHQTIMHDFDTASQSLYDACRLLKKMRDDKLYIHLGYELFDNYVEDAVGIKARQAYTYIKTYENLGSEFLQSNAKLGITKLNLLTGITPAKREEFTENNDLEGMSVKDVKKLVEELNGMREQLSLFESEKKENESSKEELRRKITELEKMLEDSESEKKELLERPIDVAVEPVSNEDKEKMRSELKSELEKDYEKRLKKAEKEQEKARTESQAQLEKEKAELIKSAQEKALESLKISEQEKQDALERAEKLEKELKTSGNVETAKFKIYFEECKKQFSRMQTAIEEIKKTDTEMSDKLTRAVIALADSIIKAY